jgi:hypothetical protein
VNRWSAFDKRRLRMPELLEVARRLGVKYRWEMRRPELVAAIKAGRGGK